MNIIYVSNSTVVKQGRNDVQMTKSKWNNDSTGNVVTNYVEIISSPKHLGLYIDYEIQTIHKKTDQDDIALRGNMSFLVKRKGLQFVV